MKKFQTYIITPTWNNTDYTIRCFDSIAKNTSDYCIVWIDNASEKDSREEVQNFLDDKKIPHIAIFNDENLGFVKGTNQGIKKALMDPYAKYIVFQNNDTEVTNGWLDRYINVAESDTEIGLVGPVTSPCDSWQSSEHLKGKFDIFDNMPDYDGDHNAYAEIIKEKYKGIVYGVEDKILAFFSTLIKRETLEQVGMLSEDFGVGFRDDDDYAERARRQGWKLVLACDVFVFHNHRTTFKKRFSDKEIQSIMDKNMRTLQCKYRKLYFKFGKFDSSYIKTLFIKGWRTLREQGIKKALSDLKSFLIHGRDYFK